ncbi:MAG: hypothetical protein ACI9VR_001792 [Cognaticolwellia sp.]
MIPIPALSMPAIWMSLFLAQWPAPRDPVVSQDLLDQDESQVSVGYTSTVLVGESLLIAVANDLSLHQPLSVQARHRRGDFELRGVLGAAGDGPLLGVGLGRSLTDNPEAPWVVDVGYSAALGRGWTLSERDLVGFFSAADNSSPEPYVNHIASARLRVIPQPRADMQVPVSLRIWRSFSGVETRQDSFGLELGAGVTWQAPRCFKVGLGGAADLGPLLDAARPLLRANASLGCSWGG